MVIFMELSNNIKGAIAMTIAMAGFTINDALVKSTLDTLNAGQVMFVRGAMSSVLIFALAARVGALRPLSVAVNGVVALRVAAEIAATITFVVALTVVPLGNATSVLQFMPLAVTLGAAIFFKEPVGWRRWSAILAGFIGVMIIIRPGVEGFTPASILLVACVMFAASRDLLTRRLPAEIPTVFVTMVTTFGITIIGGLLIVPLGGWHPMTIGVFSRLALASVILLVGYHAIITAMRIGEISFVAPFRYTGLLWAIALGFLMFGDIPDRYMLLGAGIVVLSGLYTFYRENVRKAQEMSQSSQPRVMH